MSCNVMGRSCARGRWGNGSLSYSAIRVICAASLTPFAAIRTSCRSTYDPHRVAALRARYSMTDDARDQFERLLGGLRPKLHRYCARMTGSAVDGEDVV